MGRRAWSLSLSGVVYAANGTAKTWSPNIEYASDASVGYDLVKNAVSN